MARCRRCNGKSDAGFKGKPAPLFIVEGDTSELSEQSLTTQFRQTTDVVYKGVTRRFQTSEIVRLSYPLVRELFPQNVVILLKVTERSQFFNTYPELVR